MQVFPPLYIFKMQEWTSNSCGKGKGFIFLSIPMCMFQGQIHLGMWSAHYADTVDLYEYECSLYREILSILVV